MPGRLRREWGLLLLATQTLTRLPVPAPFTDGDLRRATRYFPLVGLGIGAVGAAVFALAHQGLPASVAALLSLAATILLTGGLHEDGLADACDGLFGGRTRDQALAIMRDSRVGAFAVLGLGVTLGTKVLATAALLADAPAAILASHAAGRFFAILPPTVLPYARPDGMAGRVAAPRPMEIALAALFAALPLLLLGARAIPALLAAALAAALFNLAASRRLGGYTGDTLGATELLAETAILLAALWHPHAGQA